MHPSPWLTPLLPRRCRIQSPSRHLRRRDIRSVPTMKTRERSRSDSDLCGLQSSGSRRGGSRRTFPQPVFDEPPMKELDTSGRCSDFLDIELWCGSCRDASSCDGRRQRVACERPLDNPDHPKHANQNEYVEGHRRLYERKMRSSAFAFGDPNIGRRGSGSSAARMDDKMLPCPPKFPKIHQCTPIH